ncbi:P-type DNA transfer protein VirB5 [Xylella fastidiosa]|uniref:P-type DNA transfer protein VirB5 n=2 Tax=Xylella fastidiosa TaxID=2371 RepID=A0AAJ5R341_XYLFS|nr:P-type DNA transfer protein VirB5 [Xylella fastidiosa]WCF29564.1 P-type DNA transfer protein VirB5 [Xylella fastidiosa subsp. fastidiosa]
MKLVKKPFGPFALMIGLSVGNLAHAGMPVIDWANLEQAQLQVEAWKKQYEQMASQIEQVKQQYNSINGIRNMGSLVNNPAARQYLPANYATILSQGVGNWEAIRSAAEKFDVSMTSLAANSDTAQAFQQAAKQAALNRASAELAYSTASQRFSDIQVLLDKINNAPDAKDIADLQARIQAEQVMMQNEANKLQALQLLVNAQRDLQIQQMKEIRMKSSRGPMPKGW